MIHINSNTKSKSTNTVVLFIAVFFIMWFVLYSFDTYFDKISGNIAYSINKTFESGIVVNKPAPSSNTSSSSTKTFKSLFAIFGFAYLFIILYFSLF